MLIADAIKKDASIKKAKKDILEHARGHIEKIEKVQAPKKELIETYDAAVKKLGHLRGLPLWYPYIGSGAGNGALVELSDGSVKYDFITGIGVHFGHNHPQVMEAVLDASLENIVMQGNLLQNQEALQLTELLTKVSGMDHAFLTTSGAMANENGLKILFQKKLGSSRILAFDHTFMGRTLALANISDKPLFREGLPPAVHVDYIPFYDWKDPEGSTKRAVSTLKKFLWRYPGAYACMCFELVLGEAGYYPAPPSFFQALVEILKKHEVRILVDEIQTFGRHESLFVFQKMGIEKAVDVVTVGKLCQLGATLFRKEVKPKPALISQTYTASTASLKASIVIINSLLNDGYLGESGKINKLRHHFVKGLEEMAKRHPELIQGPFGSGLMIAFTPYLGEQEKVIAFSHALFNNGVISFIAGENPTRVRFLLPAGGVTTKNIDEVLHIIEKTLKEKTL